MLLLVFINFKSAHLISTENNSFACLNEYGDVHVMQDAQDDRSQICLNYVTKGPNVFANISR